MEICDDPNRQTYLSRGIEIKQYLASWFPHLNYIEEKFGTKADNKIKLRIIEIFLGLRNMLRL